jgi:curved DNA-binding protein CbpA
MSDRPVISSSFALLLIVLALLYSLPFSYLVLRKLLCPPPGPAADPLRPAASRVRAAARERARRSFVTIHGALVALCVALIMGLSPYAIYREFDPYAVLGVGPDVSEKGLATAFRRLSLKHHPDKGGDRATFQQLKRAYDVLTKEEEKRNFAAFGNPEGKVQDKFGDMAGASRGSKKAMLLGYIAALGAVVVFLVRGGTGTANAEDGEFKNMSDEERTLKRALAMADLVAALPGRKSGVPEREFPDEDEGWEGARGAARRGGGGAAARREGKRATNAAAIAARAAAAQDPPPRPFQLPAGEDFFDFFEPRFEAVQLNLTTSAAFPPFGCANTPREEALRFYEAWQAAGAKLKQRDYAHEFEAQLARAVGKDQVEKDYTSEKDEWRALLFKLKLDQEGREERRAAEAARLKELLEAARGCDPRLPKEAPAAPEAAEGGGERGEQNPRLGEKI